MDDLSSVEKLLLSIKPALVRKTPWNFSMNISLIGNPKAVSGKRMEASLSLAWVVRRDRSLLRSFWITSPSKDSWSLEKRWDWTRYSYGPESGICWLPHTIAEWGSQDFTVTLGGERNPKSSPVSWVDMISDLRSIEYREYIQGWCHKEKGTMEVAFQQRCNQSHMFHLYFSFHYFKTNYKNNTSLSATSFHEFCDTFLTAQESPGRLTVPCLTCTSVPILSCLWRANDWHNRGDLETFRRPATLVKLGNV